MSWHSTTGRFEGPLAVRFANRAAPSRGFTERAVVWLRARRQLILRCVVGAGIAGGILASHQLFPATLPFVESALALLAVVVLGGWYGGNAAGGACALTAAMGGAVRLLTVGPSDRHWTSFLAPIVFLCVSFALLAAVDVLRGTTRRLKRHGTRLRQRTHRRVAMLRKYAIEMKRADELRARRDEEVRLVMTHARCILWHAIFELHEPTPGEQGTRSQCPLASVTIQDETAAQEVLPLHVPPGSSYASVWVSRRHPQDALAAGRKCLDAISSGKKSYRSEYRCVDAEGCTRWLAEDVQIGPLGGGRWRLVGVTTDVTESRTAESALRVSEDRFARFMERLPGIAFLKGEDGRYVYMNEGCRRLMEMPLANSVADQFKSGDWEVWETGGVAHTIEKVTVNGERRYFMMCRFLIATGEATSKWLGSIGIDITNLKVAEDKVLKQRAQIRSLATDLTRTEERERRQIASALHDQVGASLALARIRLEAATKDGVTGLDEAAVRDVIDAVSAAMEQTRSLTYQLSVPILYEAGLEAALGWLGDDMASRHGLEVAVSGDGAAGEADQEIQIALFQVTRELLVNVVKHAGAKSVLIGLRRDGERLRLQVVDDGVGLDLSAPRKDGFGLFSVRERLRSLGGRLEIESAPGQGVRAVIVLPLRIARTESHVAARRPG